MPPVPDREPNTAPPAGGRRRSREICLRALYRSEVVGDSLDQVTRETAGDERLPEEVRDYSVHLLSLIAHGLEEIDAEITAALTRWNLKRLAVTDRCVLRMGAAELMFVPTVPPEVAMNEAIEIARRFGAEGSPGFVNGVLDRVAKNLAKGKN